MEEGFMPDLFIAKDYEVEKFTYKNVEQNCYCLKSGSTDYDLTGQIIWRAATQLAEFIIDNNEQFKDKVVLELGAGAGISGLVCSQYAKTVFITDGNDIVTELMVKNLEFNKQQNVLAEKYEWGKIGDEKFLETKQGVKIDMIIGADILFWPDGIAPLAETLETYFSLNKNLVVYIASRIRALWVEKKFEYELAIRNLKRTKMFEEGENKFFNIQCFQNEQEKQEKIASLNQKEILQQNQQKQISNDYNQNEKCDQ